MKYLEKGEIEKQIAEIQTKLDAAWADDDEDGIDKFDEMIVGLKATMEELLKQLEEEFPWVEEAVVSEKLLLLLEGGFCVLTQFAICARAACAV